MSVAMCLIATLLRTDEALVPTDAKLAPEFVRAGWVRLFDGTTPFGWRTEQAAKIDLTVEVADGSLVAPRPDLKPSLVYDGPLCRTGQVSFELDSEATVTTPDGRSKTARAGWGRVIWRVPPGQAPGRLSFSGGRPLLSLKYCHVRFYNLEPIFDGKTLAGWDFYTGDPKRNLSTAAVTPAGELHLKGGPGDLQSKETYADFCLQLDAKTNAANLNRGVFFRCVAGQYQQGYEVQIQNGHAPNDPTKPTDFGTGAIYRRVPARRVHSKDGEYFTLTVIAIGDRISTWVEGEPVVQWRDERPENANARQGKKLGAGHLSLQGHDPTTDLLFRALRISRE